MNARPDPAAFADADPGIIKLAMLAVGGQGGGVVTTWIVDLAESQGWLAQSTSVAGVAQRTGATIYYVEMVPPGALQGADAMPVLSLSPAQGDVDILLAAELMEAGRAVQRGFVTPDRTTLIASSHRSLAVGEKEVPGNGILDDAPILEAAHLASRRFLHADLEALAVANGSVISASLFGALAGAEVLPFGREAFEETIRRSGKGVERSLAAFAAGFDAVRGEPAVGADPGSALDQRSTEPVEARLPVTGMPGETPLSRHDDGTAKGPDALRAAFGSLMARIEAELPAPAHVMAQLGLRKVVDFQDLDYGIEYLDRLKALAAKDRLAGGDRRDFAFTEAAAKYVANAMAYDDVIRVADLKTRGTRTARLHAEIGSTPDQVVRTTEYMHPRMEEVCGMMPVRLGRAIEARPKLFSALDRLVSRGRRVRTDGVFWFGMLYAVSALRPHRRSLLRHAVETRHMNEWLATAERLLPVNYALAVEVLRCRRLIKGYSDTHRRGLSKFDRALSALPLLEGREDGGEWLARIRTAALMDEGGEQLDGALRTVATL